MELGLVRHQFSSFFADCIINQSVPDEGHVDIMYELNMDCKKYLGHGCCHYALLTSEQ